jgi:hypothetical protein
MRALQDLISPSDDAWPQLQEWMAGAARPVEMLPGDRSAGEATLLALQVTTRSMLGTIALHVGGILIDRGWVRILGSGHMRVGGGLREWNANLGGDALDPPLDQALLVAYDAVGGFFAINGGAWPTALGTMHYFAPDSFAWESLDIGHAAFTEWAMSEKLDQFYADSHWPGWEADVEALGPDQVISVWPPLGLKGADMPSSSVAERSRSAVPAREHWSFMNEIGPQLVDLPDGASVRFQITD